MLLYVTTSDRSDLTFRKATHVCRVHSRPEYERRKKVPAGDQQREWRSCCFKLHPQFLVFMIQVFFSAFLIFFSAYKLADAVQPDPLYVSMLTTTVGVWLPSPLHSTNKGSLLT